MSNGDKSCRFGATIARTYIRRALANSMRLSTGKRFCPPKGASFDGQKRKFLKLSNRRIHENHGQREKILNLLLTAARAGRSVSALELSEIALQYAARVHELRKKLGFTIELIEGPRVNGVRRTSYRLVLGPALAKRTAPAEPAQFTLDAVNAADFLAFETGARR